jgi:hypothetical protein
MQTLIPFIADMVIFDQAYNASEISQQLRVIICNTALFSRLDDKPFLVFHQMHWRKSRNGAKRISDPTK